MQKTLLNCAVFSFGSPSRFRASWCDQVTYTGTARYTMQKNNGKAP